MSSTFDARYRAAEYFYGTLPNDFLRESAGRIPAGGRVLCLAEGEGRNAVWLAEQGFAVTAVDLSVHGLRKLHLLAERRGVQVSAVCADLADFQMGQGQWDGIISIFCHLPPAVRTVVHARSVAALRPGGVFVLEAYRPEQVGRGTGGPPDPSFCISREVLETDFALLEWLLLERRERAVMEGIGHTGVGAVIQFIGVRPPRPVGEQPLHE